MASTCRRGREGRDTWACILKFVAELAWGLCISNCTSWAQIAMKMIEKKKVMPIYYGGGSMHWGEGRVLRNFFILSIVAGSCQ